MLLGMVLCATAVAHCRLNLLRFRSITCCWFCIDAIVARVQVMSAFAPKVASALVFDRDEFMTQQLLELCRASSHRPHVVVGVVGLAHLDGIERRFQFAEMAG